MQELKSKRKVIEAVNSNAGMGISEVGTGFQKGVVVVLV